MTNLSVGLSGNVAALRAVVGRVVGSGAQQLSVKDAGNLLPTMRLLAIAHYVTVRAGAVHC